MFEIEKNVPLPDHKAGETGFAATLQRMEVGESFLLPGGHKKSNQISSAFSKFAQTRAGAGKRFAQRKRPEGIRIWRMA